MSSAHDAAGAVMEAVSVGDLTPTEGAQVMGLVDSYRRTLEVTELESAGGVGGAVAAQSQLVTLDRPAS
jgi:hypothetical protein